MRLLKPFANIDIHLSIKLRRVMSYVRQSVILVDAQLTDIIKGKEIASFHTQSIILYHDAVNIDAFAICFCGINWSQQESSRLYWFKG